jgi:osmotically-inducible protein OsmY
MYISDAPVCDAAALSGSAFVSRNEVEQAAQSRLHASPYPSLKRLKCEFNRGQLVLRGPVHSFFEKQMAQEAIAGVQGVEQIVNGIEVG